jgi:TROVE domain
MSRLTKAEQWELLIPEMGYMAQIRNLRNFDQAGISDVVAAGLASSIADPARVVKSRQLPFRFWAAYRAAPSLRWGQALEVALNATLQNIPVLGGRSLILIDTSASMSNHMSGRGTVSRVEAAAIFGLALALKTPDQVDVWGFADGQFRVTGVDKGASLLRSVEAFVRCVGNVGHGTYIQSAVDRTYAGHDRVFIFTDMQTFPSISQHYLGTAIMTGDVSRSVPPEVPVYGFNLSGYSHTAMPAGHGNRHEMGGLTDATFTLIPAIEAGTNGEWPWEQ